MVALNFSARGVKPNVALEAVPTGMYPVVIVKSEEKPTKAGTGTYIEFEMQIQASPHVDPAYHGRKVFDRLNTNNQNQAAVDIAYATLSAICHVTGVLDMTDTQQLHGRPFVAVVQKKIRDDLPPPAPGEKDERPYSNEIKGYKDMNGNDPGFAGATTVAANKPAFAQQANPAQTQQVQQVDPNAAAPSWAGNQPAQTEQVQQPAQVQQEQVQQPVQQAAPSWAQKAG